VSAARTLARLVLPAAVYGFSIGAVHSWRFALANLIKFPLLVLATAALCAASYYLVARFSAPQLRLADVSQLVLTAYGDTAVLLCSLAGVCFFVAVTMDQPRSLTELGDYPTFLALNVAFVGTCGCVAVARQARVMLERHQIQAQRRTAIVVAWLALSLLVGGQLAWYLRPFVGIRTVIDDGSLCHGDRPDPRGATNFYEAVYHLIAPPAR
jgi:hypothetical protein